MRTKLTWLHISDIHFNPKTDWRDGTARDSLIDYLKSEINSGDTKRPDLIFCTGDIAYGEIGSSPLADQYEQAKIFFDELLTVCGQEDSPLPKERLFVVPGNHDVNRKNINSDAQAILTHWAQDSIKYADMINERFNDRTYEFQETIKRLNEYAHFVQTYLPHQHDSDTRHRYSSVVDIDGLKVGVAGFDSAWSCAGPEDDRTVWLAAEWQFNAAKREINGADVKIGLVHHPVDWLNPTDSKIATRRISTDFHFWLHGHIHNVWIVPTQSCINIAAGAVGAKTSEEFGINLVEIDLSELTGTAYLHHRMATGTSWTVAPIEVHAPSGKWPLKNLPSSLRKDKTFTTTLLAEGAPVLRIQKLFGREKLGSSLFRVGNGMTGVIPLPGDF